MESFLLLAGIFFGAVIIGVPIAFSFLLSCIIFITVDPRLTLQMIPPILYSSLDSFPLLAIPLFIFAGDLMAGGKVSEKLLHFATSLVGKMPGHLGAVTTLGSMFFGAVSGSGPATTAAIGGMVIPEMIKTPGYSKGYITSLNAASGFLGVLIPPSIPFVMYGFMTNTSIGDLFIGGIVPGVLLGVLFILWNTYQARKNGVPTSDIPLEGFWLNVWRTFVPSIWALLMPVIILGGIYSGIFTPTEAAGVAVVYGAIVGLFVYKGLKLKDIGILAGRSVYTTLTFMPIFVFASVFSRILTITNMTQDVIGFLTSITDSTWIILLLINIFLFLLGMVMDPITGILLVAPLIYPVAVGHLGLDPVHFGIITVTNLAVGMITPPLAGNLFVSMRLTGATFQESLKPLLPFVAMGIAVVLLVTYVPSIPMFLLNLLK